MIWLPILQTATGVSNISIPVVVGAAVIDSINPCAFGVLIFILGYLIKVSKNRKRVLIDGSGYVIGVYLTYLFLGALIYLAIGGVLESMRGTPLVIYFYQIIGTLIMLAGILEIKEFFAYGVGPSLSIFPRFAKRIKVWTKYLGKKAANNFKVSFTMSLVLGFLVALVELPCTGAPYIAVLIILSRAGLPFDEALPLLMVYNIIFVLPLIAIIALVYKGTTSKKLKHWKEENKGLMRLGMGMMLIAMGLFIFFFDIFFGG
jgi:cytochrome c biogenesis protein CcdA